MVSNTFCWGFACRLQIDNTSQSSHTAPEFSENRALGPHNLIDILNPEITLTQGAVFNVSGTGDLNLTDAATNEGS